jgi:hypothetical protein
MSSDVKAMKKLIEDLEQKPNSTTRNTIIKNANNLLYSDYSSSLTFPKMLLVNDLNKAGFDDLSKKTQNGEYDS